MAASLLALKLYINLYIADRFQTNTFSYTTQYAKQKQKKKK